jgi:predicted nucleotidyltransferase
VGYTKVTSLDERNGYLRRNAGEYLWFDAQRGREMEAVPLERVAYVLDPVSVLGQFRDMGIHVSGLQKASVDLANLLVMKGGVDRGDVGITGSQLAGLETSESDIDMVVYGESSGRMLFRKLQYGAAGLEKMKRYEGEKLDRHVAFRWPEISQFSRAMRDREERKVLQGVFGKYEFFIRLVKRPAEYEYKYGDFVVEPAERTETTCYVLDSQDSIFTPCEYMVSSSDLPGLLKLVSYRGRFTEHARSGETVEVRGRLESVKHVPTDERYLQIVLGESGTDYMVVR